MQIETRECRINRKTTEIYTHITKKGISRITSPLDNLDIENEN